MRSILAALALFTCAAAEAQPPFANIITLAGKRPPLEPGSVFAGNAEGALAQLRAAMAQPADQSAQLIADLKTYGLDNLAPPMLLEYARRLHATSDPDWSYYFNLYSIRARVDGASCADRTAAQYRAVLLQEFSNALNQYDRNDFKKALVAMNETQVLTNIRRIVDNGDIFKSKASAWWICSHGISTIGAAALDQTLTLEQWWIGQDKADAGRKQTEAGLLAQLKEKGF